jgi:hypothetical protein
MALRDWLINSDPVATATIATTATKRPSFHPTVATVATVAVAEHEICENEPAVRSPSIGGELPKGCPLIGGPVPSECRFETKLFKRMIRQGVLPIGGPCPLHLVCGSDTQKINRNVREDKALWTIPSRH